MLKDLSILIVDDDAGMRNVLAALLSAEGHLPVSAGNGTEAAEVMAREPVDLILTDILMPDKDGLELIKDVRGAHKRIPIVAFSGGGYRIGTRYCLQIAKAIGATTVISKPFDRQQLLSAIEDAMGQACGSR
jgi:DNA-binding NtrC family response regulator